MSRAAERAAVLRALFAQGPIYEVVGERVGRTVSVTSHGPGYSFRRLALRFQLAGGGAVEVTTAVTERRSMYVAGLRGMPPEEEVAADAGPEGHLLLSIDGVPTPFERWNAAEGGTVAAATLGERSILLDIRDADPARLTLRTLHSFEPFLA